MRTELVDIMLGMVYFMQALYLASYGTTQPSDKAADRVYKALAELRKAIEQWGRVTNE
jgi:hypothetical protein